MAVFPPHGKNEAMLERLVAGDCSFISLANAAGCGLDRKKQDKLWHSIGSLLKHGLIGGKRERYYILPAGRQLLDGLRSGRTVTVEEPASPSVRVFA